MSATRPIYEIYIDDDRYSVPTLHLAPAANEAGARAIIEGLLNDAHHIGAELYLAGRRLAAMGSFADTPQERPGQSAALQ